MNLKKQLEFGLHRIEHELQHDFHITHTTIQFDCSTCNGGPLIKELNHAERPATCNGHGHA